ncbi:coat protein duplicate 2 [Grapevine leafroll-associated virus 1]|uniref:Coat protein duplicate 2 n=1 Tax=Grapevine leafroll-associated virus 1 TaxID=47985 RepID=G9L8F3_9CLOS|nr:CPd2 gene product [Grapevine leafroll-associated virus 1]AEW24408.1 coat protein duplicate 2 [Grapevine leafroll-associated virus 1]QBZ78731.1 coat protein duplicate 2 [Grapevine leafroll-associated virus 1]
MEIDEAVDSRNAIRIYDVKRALLSLSKSMVLRSRVRFVRRAGFRSLYQVWIGRGKNVLELGVDFGGTHGAKLRPFVYYGGSYYYNEQMVPTDISEDVLDYVNVEISLTLSKKRVVTAALINGIDVPCLGYALKNGTLRFGHEIIFKVDDDSLHYLLDKSTRNKRIEGLYTELVVKVDGGDVLLGDVDMAGTPLDRAYSNKTGIEPSIHVANVGDWKSLFVLSASDTRTGVEQPYTENAMLYYEVVDRNLEDVAKTCGYFEIPTATVAGLTMVDFEGMEKVTLSVSGESTYLSKDVAKRITLALLRLPLTVDDGSVLTDKRLLLVLIIQGAVTYGTRADFVEKGPSNVCVSYKGKSVRLDFMYVRSVIIANCDSIYITNPIRKYMRWWSTATIQLIKLGIVKPNPIVAAKRGLSSNNIWLSFDYILLDARFNDRKEKILLR